MTELNQEGFERLLALFDADPNKAADEYLKFRRRLNFFFERKNVRSADELTDETISRVTQKLASGVEKAGGEIRNIAAYCQKFASLVLFEERRARERQMVEATEELPDKSGNSDDELLHQQRFTCMRECLQRANSRERDLVKLNCTVDDRDELARKLGLTINALRIRVSRIREKLRLCLARCMKKLA